MHPKKYTLQDIAKLAQVSRGTVDRVVNKRGKVSAKAKKRVEDVLKELDYKPNLIARSLKRHKDLVIAVVIPHPNPQDIYWNQCAQGIEEAGKKLDQFGIILKYFHYHKSKESFATMLELALELNPNAVLMAPIHYEELKPLFSSTEMKGIPIGLINTPIEELNYMTFVGQDYYKSGRLAAQLMDNLVEPFPKCKILIAHLGIDTDHAIHLKDKEKGFKAYFKEHNAKVEIDTVSFASDNLAEDLPNQLEDFIGIYVTTSKAHLLSTHLNKHPKMKVIGYDLVPKNIAQLQTGNIHILLNQNPKLQGDACINTLSEHLLYNTEVARKRLFPIDIVLTENLESYI
ncbi:LacI family DNA-binding transcriptional regulator [Flagellimonas myxillae]|uniref:substrate-binding domain-containing protein n=1 Tax=Flagellimonas myxillae TaxID=2942214 RepID=UPI00201F4475|nr:LacI family DNA-binding transcriptional regulator [Muricauda myxillae]MCL6264988.1 LacI family transcriptional regulator [Muricauda myxillae]